MRLERVVETATSLVGFGSRGDGRVVLKVVSGRHEEWDAGAVAAAFAGRGMVRVHEHVPGAALLEELRPATPLAELVEAGRDDGATSILADVVAAMLDATPATTGHATAADQRADFDRYLASGDRRIATALVEEARERWAGLCRTQTGVRLHGDLQHHNILRDVDRDRVVAWTFAQAVLSAIWMTEQEGEGEGEGAVERDGPALSVARATRELLLRQA